MTTDQHPDLSTMSGAEKRALLAELLQKQGAEPIVERLSFPQERLWFLDQLDPGAPTYNIPSAVPLHGYLDRDALERAVQEMARRHEVLRTTFARRGDEPVQVVWPSRTVPLEVHDLRDLHADARQREVDRLAKAEGARGFDLARGPLIRTTLLRLQDAESLLLLTIHHIVSDGWSMNILTYELQTLYAAFAAGRPSPLPPLPIQYRHYARRQRAELEGEALEAHMEFWRARLEDAPGVLDLPIDGSRPAVQSSRGWVQPFAVDSEVARKLQVLAAREGATMFMTLLAAFDVFLHRHTGAVDLVVGAPVANRTTPDIEPLIGFFINTLILRTDVSGNPTFRELLARVRDVALAVYEHQEVPFEKIVEEIQPDRDLSRNPIFQVAFALQAPNPTDSHRPMPDHIPLVETQTAKFDITLGMSEVADGIHGGLECNADLFDGATTSRFTERFVTLLAAIAEAPDTPIGSLSVIGDDERTRLIHEWNDTAAEFPDVCFHELIEQAVDEQPDAPAAEFGDEVLTYAQLDQRANQLAHHLRARGAGPEVRIAICLERGINLAVAVLGVMKSGGAYVPLDPTSPVSRLGFILDDAGVELIVTTTDLAHLFVDADRPVIRLDGDREALAAEPVARPAVPVDPLNLAWVIYTSGSTGVPKGIFVPHAGGVNMAAAEVKDFRLGPGDRVIQTAPLIFDVSIWEMAMTLPAGATLVFATEDEIVDGSVINEKHITAGSFTPALLGTLDPADYPDLRFVISVGEASTERIKETWPPGRRALNVYGPTETTGHCSWVELVPGEELTIGRPIQNVRLYVLDDALQLVPTGVVGELCVSSAGMTRGYVGRAAHTAERFVPDPFSGIPGGRLYRTGDLVRYLHDGRVEFLGRIDHQVKIRGFRIELGEIETVLGALPGVASVVAMARDDEPGDTRLVAYVVADAGVDLDTGSLRRALRDTLPEYMVPGHIVQLPELPLNSRGKIDRAALPSPTDTLAAAAESEPMTVTEQAVAEIWEDVLKVPVTVDDNFFDLGGHSLLATGVIGRIMERFGVELPMRVMFLGPTVAELAARIDEHEPSVEAAADETIGRSERRIRIEEPPPGAEVALDGDSMAAPGG